MTRDEFRKLIENGPVILDGAMGTNLIKAGLQLDDCTETWALEHPEAVIQLQKAYVEAGTQIVYAPTFGANCKKLKSYGLENRAVELNRALVALSKQAVGDVAYIAGDMTMTGQIPYPIGDISFDELVEVYKEQASSLVEAGVDLFVVETMMSLQECRAAIIAIKEVCDLPIMATLTFNKDGRTLYATPADVGLCVLQSLGVDAIGVNCSSGPEDMVPIIQKMAEYATVPLIAKPNAGIPELNGRETIYRMTPEDFANAGKQLIEAGAALIGGCCGTTPEHIKCLASAVKGMNVHMPLEVNRKIVTSERKLVEIKSDGNLPVIGKQIHAAENEELQEELREGCLDTVYDMALDQEDEGAELLNINVTMSGVDEAALIKDVIYEVVSAVDCPLVIDTVSIEVLEAALRIYPGCALINQDSINTENADAMQALAKKYGAMMLPLSR